jgi:hypothetical protein
VGSRCEHPICAAPGHWCVGPLGPLRGGLGIERAVLACAVCGATWGVHVGCGWGGRPREFC